MKQKKMNNFDLLRAIKFSYGKILDEWKEAGIIPDKEAMLDVASPFSIPFILDNYSLDERDLEVLRFSVLEANSNNQEIIALIEKKIEDLMDNNQSFSFGEAKALSVSQIVERLDGEDVRPVPYHKSYDWATLDDIFTQKPDFFNERNMQKEAFVVAVLSTLDFSNLPVRNSVFNAVSKFVYNASIGTSRFDVVVSNVSFSRKVLSSFAEGDEFIEGSIEHKVPLDAITSKQDALNFVKTLYKQKKENHLYLNHQKEIPPNILEEEEKDPEYFNRYMENRLKTQKEFLEEKAKFGESGLFIFELSDKTHKKLNEFLTDAEISKITDDNFLPGISYDEIDNHIAKIQSKITDMAGFRLSKWNQKTIFNSHFLLDLTKLVPSGGESKVLSNDFIKYLHNKFSEHIDEKNQEVFTSNWYSKNTEGNSHRVVEIISSLAKDERNAPFLNKSLIANALIEFNFLQRTQQIFKTVEEFEDRVSKLFIDMKSTLKIDLLAQNHFEEPNSIVSESISRIISRINENANETAIKENIAAKVMEAGGNIETALSLGLILSAQNGFDFVSKEENSIVGTGFYIDPDVGLDTKATPNVFTDGEINITNKDSLNLKMQSKVFRERLLTTGVKVPSSAIISLISNTNEYAIYQETTKEITDGIDDFIDRYLKRFPDVMDKSFIEAKVLDKRVYPKTYNLFMGKLTLDKAFDDYKTGNKETLATYVEALRIFSNEDNKVNTPIKELHTFFERSIKELSEDDLKTYVLSKHKILFHYSTLLKLGYNQEDLVKTIAHPDNYVPLDWSSLDEGHKKFLCEKYRAKNGEGYFCKHLTIYDKNTDIQSICDAFKKYAPSMLLTEEFKSLFKAGGKIELADLVNGAKEIAKLDMIHLKPITIGQAELTILEDSNFTDAVKDLSPREKIVLIKYGAAFQKPLTILKQEDHNKLFKPRDFNTPVTEGYASKLHLALNDVFSDEFIKENKEYIARVYALKEFLNSTMPGNLSYNLGSSSGYFATLDKRSKLSFKGIDAWADLMVEKAGQIDNLDKISNLLRKSWSFKEVIQPKLLKNYDLAQPQNLDNFVMLLRNGSSEVKNVSDENIKSSQILLPKKIIESIALTILDAPEDTQKSFLKIYDVLSLSSSAGNKELNGLEKIFVFSPEIQDRVKALKTYLKIDNIIKGVIANEDDDFPASDSFKL